MCAITIIHCIDWPVFYFQDKFYWLIYRCDHTFKNWPVSHSELVLCPLDFQNCFLQTILTLHKSTTVTALLYKPIFMVISLLYVISLDVSIHIMMCMSVCVCVREKMCECVCTHTSHWEKLERKKLERTFSYCCILSRASFNSLSLMRASSSAYTKIHRHQALGNRYHPHNTHLPQTCTQTHKHTQKQAFQAVHRQTINTSLCFVVFVYLLLGHSACYSW